MLGTLTVLLLCQLAGELIARLLSLPIPGPVIGMVLLFVGLMLRGGPPMPMQETAGVLLRNLSLLFVPAGVGVMTHLTQLGDEILPIGAALVGSTLIGIGLTAFVMSVLVRRSDAEVVPDPEPATPSAEDAP